MASVWARVFGWFAGVWTWLKGLLSGVSGWFYRNSSVFIVAVQCRFSIVVILLVIAAFLLNDQAREIAVGLDASDGFPYLQAGFFALGAAYWELHCWFGARWLLENLYGRPWERGEGSEVPEPERRFHDALRIVPRAVSVAAAIAVFAVFPFSLRSGLHLSGVTAVFMVISLAVGLLVFLFIVYRSEFRETVEKRFPLYRALSAWRPGGDPDRGPSADLVYLRNVLMVVSWVVFLALFLAAWLAPVEAGRLVGPLGVLFFSLGMIVPLGSWLVFITRPRGRPGAELDGAPTADSFPVVTLLLLVTCACSFLNDNHQVRTLPLPACRASLEDRLADWRRFGREEPRPLVIVATAGGGLRAAYWTATVLGELTREIPDFHESLFAVSGVSGGAVGATFYAAALGDLQERGCAVPKNAMAARNALDGDSLTPLLLRFLSIDMAQRFLPFGLMPDRQEALELTWEASWRAAMGRQGGRAGEAEGDGLAEGFCRFFAQDCGSGWRPLLLLNGTHVETGKRIIQAPFPLYPDEFLDVIDYFALTGGDIRLSTAAGNSARFTFVSPAGTLERNGNGLGHVVDGGYYENFGAETARELMLAVLRRCGGRETGNRAAILPIFILISSDPDLVFPDEDAPRGEALPSPLSWAPEVRAPLTALLNTRNARGVRAAEELEAMWGWMGSAKALPDAFPAAGAPHFFHFRMEVPAGAAKPALGWLLSRESRENIAGMLSKAPACAHNARELARLRSMFTVVPGYKGEADKADAGRAGAGTAAGECMGQ